MSTIFEVMAECIGDLRKTEHSLSKADLLSLHVVKRLEQFSISADKETLRALKGIEYKVLHNNQLSVSKKAREIEKFSKIATGASTTYLGFLSRLLHDHFLQGDF